MFKFWIPCLQIRRNAWSTANKKKRLESYLQLACNAHLNQMFWLIEDNRMMVLCWFFSFRYFWTCFSAASSAHLNPLRTSDAAVFLWERCIRFASIVTVAPWFSWGSFNFLLANAAAIDKQYCIMEPVVRWTLILSHSSNKQQAASTSLCTARVTYWCWSN